jgi:preprotein translocase SecE subunit
MANQATANEGKPGIVQKIQDYIRDVKVEMDKVTWPTLNDLKVSTKVTMYLLLVMGVVMFVFDWVFAKAVLLMLSLSA